MNVLSAHFGGGGAVIIQQLQAIERTQPQVRLRVLAAPWNEHALRQQLRSPVITVPVRDGLGRVAWEQTMLLWRARSADVLYCPGNTAPLGPTRSPVVLLLQNPNMFGSGRDLAHNHRWYRRTRIALTQASVRRAEQVVVVSRSLRDDVAADFPRLASRLTVIPFGAPPLPEPGAPPAALRPIPASFVVSIANDAPHKRLDDTVLAWSKAFDHTTAIRNPDGPPALVMAGVISPARRAQQLAAVAPELRDRVRYLGAVTDRHDVAWLLRHARASLSSSSLESFGLVTLEAATFGCPLILTDIPAHREVAGDRARFVPVADTVAMAAALQDVVTATGTEQAAWTWPVTWDDHARHLVGVFRRAAADSSPTRLQNPPGLRTASASSPTTSSRFTSSSPPMPPSDPDWAP